MESLGWDLCNARGQARVGHRVIILEMVHCGKSLISVFQRFFASISEIFIWRGTGRWAIILWVLDTFLIFPKYLSLESWGNS